MRRPWKTTGAFQGKRASETDYNPAGPTRAGPGRLSQIDSESGLYWGDSGRLYFVGSRQRGLGQDVYLEAQSY